MIKLPGKKRTLGAISNSVLLVRGMIVDLQNGSFFFMSLYIYKLIKKKNRFANPQYIYIYIYIYIVPLIFFSFYLVL